MYTLPSYFNTTALKGKNLERGFKKAESQDKIILDCFLRKRSLTPSQIYRFRQSVGLGNVPLTSIRRSITVLTDDGRLIKTEKRRIGLYGRWEYVWEVNSEQLSLAEKLFTI
jgi:transcription initiation factor IIE alpha subunit